MLHKLMDMQQKDMIENMGAAFLKPTSIANHLGNNEYIGPYSVETYKEDLNRNIEL